MSGRPGCVCQGGESGSGTRSGGRAGKDGTSCAFAPSPPSGSWAAWPFGSPTSVRETDQRATWCRGSREERKSLTGWRVCRFHSWPEAPGGSPWDTFVTGFLVPRKPPVLLLKPAAVGWDPQPPRTVGCAQSPHPWTPLQQHLGRCWPDNWAP